MKIMKKITGIVAAVAMMACLVGCGNTVAANTVFSADDLPGKTIGVQLGTTGDIYASDYESEGSTIERYSKGNDAVQALKQGKIDCVIIDNQPAVAFVEKNDDLKILDDPFEIEDYAICVAKENAELTASMNEALNSLKADGTLDKIIGNYIGDATKGTFKYECTGNHPNGQLIMATNAAFEPYEYIENNEIVGADVDIAKAICDMLGYELVIEDMEFDAVINAVQSGKADFGMSGMTVTEERLKNIDFTIPYTTATQVIIVRK